ncbi:two-component system response regulator KdpE [Nemorincola caseinilytica]|uniref:Two-component system response regulator KdpE n=1 Tax=Nemorincola caseinilytica TaxID=2054315 RepID=A0ABP8N9J9_9BACT
MSKAAILVIDDEAQMRKLLEITLESSGFGVLHATTGREGIVAAATHPPDMILLDIGLPDESGHEVLRKLREWYTHPIMMLSVQNSEEDIVRALDNGANDYLVKPYRTGELLARIRSLLRRSGTDDATLVVSAGDITIDLAARTVKKGGATLKLTATEYTLLSLLARNAGRVLTHQYLLREVWGNSYVNESQYLRVFIAQLRKKIEKDPNRPAIILTESRIGYRFAGADHI